MTHYSLHTYLKKTHICNPVRMVFVLEKLTACEQQYMYGEYCVHAVVSVNQSYIPALLEHVLCEAHAYNSAFTRNSNPLM